MRTEALARAFIEACVLDVSAIKPGNVGLYRSGHGMSARDFLLSAQVAAGAIADTRLGVGQRIHAAISATHAAVGCNTNLGIVLLCAPLALAAELSGGGLRQRIEQVLQKLDIADCELAYRAIRLAAPAGLGSSERHDVAQAPKVGLRTAMAEAAARDRIAAQYANGFADLWAIGLPALDAARARGWDWRSTTTAIYCAYLCAFADSHVVRKHGAAIAQTLLTAAPLRCAEFFSRGAAARQGLLDWDAELKSSGVNPGSSADLTVATVFLARLLCGIE